MPANRKWDLFPGQSWACSKERYCHDIHFWRVAMIHPTAIVSKEAKIGQEVSIRAFYHSSRRCDLGRRNDNRGLL